MRRYTYLTSYILLGVIALVCLWPQFFWPIYGEEIDYVRFARWNYNNSITANVFYDLADGHPPLLSLIFSGLLLVSTPTSMRMASFALCFGGLSFIFLWARSLKISALYPCLLCLFFIALPVHRELLTTSFGDFHGFVLLAGWAYFRNYECPWPALACLVTACLIRETHFLPAALYLFIFWRAPDIRKFCWVEFVPMLVLAAYYSASRYYTGQWYPFAGVNELRYQKLFDLYWLKATLQILLPLFFVTIFHKLRPSQVGTPRFFTKKFIFSLSFLLLILLVPYLATFHKPRLFTPFLSFYWLAVLYSWHNFASGKIIKFSMLTCVVVSSLLLHYKYVDVPSKINDIQEAEYLAGFSSALELSKESLITGEWPHYHHLTFKSLGYINEEKFSLNVLYSQFHREEFIEKYSHAPFMYFSIDVRPDLKQQLNQLCPAGCEAMSFASPSGKNWTIYFRNISEEDILKARVRAWGPK